MEQKPHAVLIPFPSQGHNHARPQPRHPPPRPRLSTSLSSTNNHNHNRILRTRGSSALTGLPDFQFPGLFPTHALPPIPTLRRI
ncbi:unnamed protein product [Rhodiola kirilowii]